MAAGNSRPYDTYLLFNDTVYCIFFYLLNYNASNKHIHILDITFCFNTSSHLKTFIICEDDTREISPLTMVILLVLFINVYLIHTIHAIFHAIRYAVESSGASPLRHFYFMTVYIHLNGGILFTYIILKIA